MFAVFLAIVANPLWALDPQRQLDQYTLHGWDQAHGLPQSSVNDIVQGDDGFIYIATFGGVVRFDGVSMRLVPEDGACGRRFFALAVDIEGSIWAGAERTRLCRLENGRLTVPTVPGVESIVHSRALLATPDGAVWVGTLEGLARIDAERVDWFGANDGLPAGHVMTLAEAGAGSLWVGTRSGLCRLSDDGCSTPEWAAPLQGEQINVIHAGLDGTLWIGTEFEVYSFDGQVLESIGLEPGGGQVRAILDDGDGNVWVGLSISGLLRIRPNLELPADGSPLRSSGVLSMMRDRERNLWVGYSADGLRKLSDGRAYGVRVPDIDTAQPFLPVTLDRHGQVWAGLACQGLVRFGAGQPRLYDRQHGFVNSCVWSLWPDRDGNIWVGTYGGGLYYLDSSGETVQRIEGLETPENIVRSILGDDQGRLWVGTDQGVWEHQVGSQQFTLLEGTEGEDISFLARSDAGSLWVGTLSGAIELGDGGIRRIDHRNGLPSGHVRAILPEPDGVVWIGTYGGGLSRIENESAVTFGLHNGLPDDIVSTIFEDAEGRFWMSGNRGVMRVPRQQLDAYAQGRRDRIDAQLFDRADGMPSSETNGGGQPAGAMLPDGRLWLPTVDGIAVFDTAGDRSNPLPPPVSVEKVLVDGQLVDHRAELVLPAGARNLEIHYTALSFRAPERVRFRYRLAGFDDRWIDAGTRREAYFPAIPPGRLRFDVIAANDDGVWNETGDGFDFEARPQFHQTPLFYLLLITIAVGAGLAVARIRIVVAGRRRRELEEQVARRTAELAKLGEITEHINRAVELNQVLEHTYDNLHEFVPYDRMILALVDTDERVIRTLWSRRGTERDGKGREFSLPIDRSGLESILEQGEPRIIADLGAELEQHPEAEATRRVIAQGVRSSIICPLSAGGSTEGFLLLSSHRPGAYQPTHADFMRQLAGHLALAVNKSRLYGELLEAKARLESSNRQLASLAARDSLTGIPNRRAFEQRLAEAWSQAATSSAPLSLLMVDVDHFKRYNDLLGHQAGDECLRKIAVTLSDSVVRKSDLVARYGGEEFAVILPDTRQAAALEVARRLCQAVAEMNIEHPDNEELGHVTVSVGCASRIPHVLERPDSLVTAADQALYQAKQSGRNRAVMASETRKA